MHFLVFLLFCIQFSVSNINLQAQEDIQQFTIPGPNELSLIRMKGEAGITYVGTIIDRTDKEINILTDANTKIQIALSNVQDIRAIPKSQIHNGEYWFPNPHDSRYFFMQSGLHLKKGEKTYLNTYLFFHSFNWAVTDNLTLGISFELLSILFSGPKRSYFDFDPIYVLTPQYTMQVYDNVRMGFGVMYGQVSDIFENVAIGYGLVTYGNSEHNATLGLGYGSFNYGYYGTNSDLVVSLSGMTRITKHVSFVTENWFYPKEKDYGSTEIFTYGIRLLWETMSLDIALLNNNKIASSIPIGIPFVNFAIKY